MSYCLNPDCKKPKNLDKTKFCQSCGSKLLLQERYRAIKPIGEGGFGRTFLGVDSSDPSEPRCVIKQFSPAKFNPNNVTEATQFFQKEADWLKKLGDHPQIPAFLTSFTQDNYQYLVQEFIEGENLAEELKQEGPFTETKIGILLHDLLPVLKVIHDAKAIHRDIKPENIIRRATDGKLILVDWGAAKSVTGTSMINTGTSIGSPAYVAPEQAKGKAVFASDLYSLGVTCIHLMTQVSPFELFNDTEDTWIWRQYLNNNSVSDRLGSILDKMLERATNRRYSSADDVLKALSSEEDSSDTAPPDTEYSKKSGLYWTLESLEVYQLQAIYKRIFWRTPPTESKQLTEKIYEFLEGFTKQHQKQTNVKEEDILSLWITHLLELVNSLSMPQEKMEATKNLILVEISKIKLLKNSQERDEKLETIAKQLLRLFFEESNAEGVFKDVISKNSEPYQSLLTKKPLKQAVQSNLLEAGTSMLLVSTGIFFTKILFPDSQVSEVITVINTQLADTANSLCDNPKISNWKICLPVNQTTTQATVNHTLPWQLIILAGFLFSIFFLIRYNNRRQKLLFIQTIFSIYSYKFQNGLEKL